MKAFLTAAMLIATSVLYGCARETTVKETTKTEGPGGTTTVTTEKSVESTGENPPAGPQGERVPPKDNKNNNNTPPIP